MAGKHGDPVCRLCRREGEKLFLKGEKCYVKCTLEKRPYPPGQHGQARRRKVSDFGIQLRAKQRARRLYGVLERQFAHYFEKAERAEGITGVVLLQQLERRLDNVVYRLGFAASRREAGNRTHLPDREAVRFHDGAGERRHRRDVRQRGGARRAEAGVREG